MAPPDRDIEAFERLRDIIRGEFGQFCPLRETEFHTLKEDVAHIKEILAGFEAIQLAKSLKDHEEVIATHSNKIGRIYAGITVVMFVVGLTAAVFFSTMGSMGRDIKDFQASNAVITAIVQEHLRVHPDTQLREDLRIDIARLEARFDAVDAVLRSWTSLSRPLSDDVDR